VSGILECACSP